MASPVEKTKPPVLPEGTRTKLLDAAGQVFAESGFQAATVREICARAGVNIALVNYHFGDKLELYTEVLRHSVGAPGNGIIKQATRSAAPAEEVFRELIHAMLLRVCRADRPGWHFRLMMHEFAQPTPAMASVIDETMRPVYDRFRELIGSMLHLSPDHDQCPAFDAQRHRSGGPLRACAPRDLAALARIGIESRADFADRNPHCGFFPGGTSLSQAQGRSKRANPDKEREGTNEMTEQETAPKTTAAPSAARRPARHPRRSPFRRPPRARAERCFR